MIFNPDTAPYTRSYVLPFFESAARSLKVGLVAAPVHSDAEIETVITALGHEPGDGLLGMPDNFVEIHRALIISLAARRNVPAVYQTLLSPETAVCFPTELTSKIYFVGRPAMWIAFYAAQSRRSFPFNCQ
jgi:hypothetical protein